MRLADIAAVTQGAENTRLASWMNRTPAVLLNIQRQPGANVIAVVDQINRILPQIRSSLPTSVDISVLTDRTDTIRASVNDVQFELSLAVALVVMVIFLFLRSVPATIIPSLSVPLSLIGTFAVMYLCGFSLNNLSLMALTIASGFVVDDAIVMIENISRYIEKGEKPLDAALKGSEEIGFTIVSLTVSLIAVLIPLLFMREVVGRLFREFAITLAISILISAVVSLTLVPMLCAKMLRGHEPGQDREQSRIARAAEAWFERLVQQYDRVLRWVLLHQTFTMWVATATLALTVALYVLIPKGFFPLQDTGILQGTTEADPTISFSGMVERQQELADVILRDPEVDSLSSFVGVDGTNTTLNNGRVLINLKPKDQRGEPITATMARLRDAARKMSGINLYLQPVQDLTIDSTVGRAQYQFILEAASSATLRPWVPRLLDELKRSTMLENVTTNFTESGLTVQIDIDRDTAARFGIHRGHDRQCAVRRLGQRIISTIYARRSRSRDHGGQSGPRARRSRRGDIDFPPPPAGRCPSARSRASRSGPRRSRSTTLGSSGRAVSRSTSLRPPRWSRPWPRSVPPSRPSGFRSSIDHVRGRGARIPVLAAQRSDADHRRDRHGLHRAGGAVRELHPPMTILSTLPSAGVGALLALRSPASTSTSYRSSASSC